MLVWNIVMLNRITASQLLVSSASGPSCCACWYFCLFLCALDCVCASLQPVRRHQSSVLLVASRLGHSGVTALGSAPAGVRPALFLLSDDTCIVTGWLYVAALWAIWGWLVVAVRVNRPGLCGYVTANAPRGGCSTLKKDKGIGLSLF